MDIMKMHSTNILSENIEYLANRFPGCVVESHEGLKIDFDQLRQELSGDIVEGVKERYRLDWPGKREAIVTSNLPSTSTLRPVRDDSVDFDNTENIYIEGDNLEVLKVLQESYLNKVKMIYIDPPYNTGKDFVYRDNFSREEEDWKSTEYRNEAGDRMVVNPDGAGRYHSDWLSMMYPRLKLARNLLTEDGVIFISIDDNEVHNLRKMCDEIFGEGNFVAQATRRRRNSQANLAKNISPIHEYVLIYKKSGDEVLNKIPAKINLNDYKNPDNDPRGPYVTMPCTNKGGAVYEVTTPTGDTIKDEWRFKKETFDKLSSDDKIVYPRGGAGKPRYKLFLSEKQEMGVIPNTWWDNLGSNQDATRELSDTFGALIFDTPKPIDLIKFCQQIGSQKDSIILDFFSGSATTAHAVMQLNAEDGGNRKYIMVQLPEETDEESEAYKAGYKNIAEIGKERIRRAATQIKTQQEAKKEAKVGEIFGQEKDTAKVNLLDLGFRVYKLDSSNMKDVYYRPASLEQDQLDMFTDNIKADRTEEDLVTQIMLDWGLPLSLKIEQKEILGTKVYAVADDYLYCCFDRGVNEEFARKVAKDKPLRIVFRDSGFANDTAKENVRQLLRQLTPETQMRVI